MATPSAAPSLETTTWLTAVAHALAREESRDERNRRLLEPELLTWNQFKGRLGPQHLLSLLLEDAAVKRPIPFDSVRVLDKSGTVERVMESVAEKLVKELSAAKTQPAPVDYINEQARRLGVSTKGARADLHAVKPNQRVLELPGSGGQLALMLSDKHNLPFSEVFTIACGTSAELTLAGLVAHELRAVPDERLFAERLLLDPELTIARKQAFDMVIGLQPDKGGHFDRKAIEGLFPAATIVLI